MSGLIPFTVGRDDVLIPNEIAQGAWGPTLGGHVVGGLLARSVDQQSSDPDMQPARLTVDILRRVASAPVRMSAGVVRTGRRMQSIDAHMTQDGEIVARASALFLRRSAQPVGEIWTTPVTMPPLPSEADPVDHRQPMFIRTYGKGDDSDNQWQHNGPRYTWLRDIRALVDGEEATPLVRAAMAVDVASSMTNFATTGLAFINADYTLTLSRLPDGPFIGLAAHTHYSDAGVATGSASLFDARGPIGTGTSTAVTNPHFLEGKFTDRTR